MSLQFKDIKDWKPSSISIVDKPAHPLAVFEVYEDDNEFIRKYSEKVNIMPESENSNNKNNVTMSESFFEKLFGGLVSKSEPTTPPEKPPVKNGDAGSDKKDEFNVEDEIAKINARLDEQDKRIDKLEKPEEDEGENDGSENEDVAPGTVKKSEENSEESDVIDDEKLVKKSKSLDPDLSSVNHKPTKSFMERIGRSEDGMKW